MVSKSKKEKILNAANVTVFTASSTVMMDYPFRLQKVGESSPTVAKKSEYYMLDSNIADDSVSNKDILDRAEYLNADEVVIKDYISEPTKTIDSLENFIDEYNQHDYNNNFCIPLQESMYVDNNGMSYEDMYNQCKIILERSDIHNDKYRFGVGGIKDMSFMNQLSAVVECSSVVEESLHGFGIGSRKQWASVIRQYPTLLDSIDSSTVSQTAVNGNVMDLNFNTSSLDNPRGKHSTVLVAMLMEWMLYQVNYMLGTLPRDDIIDNSLPEEAVSLLQSFK